MRNHTTEKLVAFHGSKGTSSKKPRVSLIPRGPINELAERFELGEEKRKNSPGGAWNALVPNPEEYLTKDFVISRLEHVIHHAYTAIAKINKLIVDDGDNDASAIMFGGCVLSEYNRIINLKPVVVKKSRS